MHLTHYGKDYRQDIASLPDAELQEFKITSDDYLLPFNPAITKVGYPVRIAFFGLNAYSHDDFEGALQQRNFIESYQDKYNSNLFTVLQLWRDGLPSTYFTDDSAIYYSNFVKIVLREDYFKGGEEVKKVLSTCDESLTLFKKLAKQEVTELSNNGCRLFICFGNVVYDFMTDISDSESENVRWIKERHYSRYTRENTEGSIQEAISWLERH